MSDILTSINTRRTLQTEQADPRQVQNSAGGYVFGIDDWGRLNRFLTLGTTGGTYYVGDRELTKDNADVVLRVAMTDPVRAVREIVAISTAGRAPKQNPAIFALAAIAGLANDEGRKAALAALPTVCRTGTHLFTFAKYVEQFRGWGRGLRRAVANWYLQKSADDLAYQVVKYRNREGWTHRDLLRLAHPTTDRDHARNDVMAWALGSEYPDAPRLISAFDEVQTPFVPVERIITLISETSLSWEMLPDWSLADPKVWRALIEKGMPQTALMRQLPRLTNLGLLNGDLGRKVAAQLADPERLVKARVHPVNVLLALRTYQQGYSARGSNSWQPVRQIVDALDAAFYASYGAVTPTGGRTFLALDVSGSMTVSCGGLPISCREATAALALVTANVEDQYLIAGFSRGLTVLDISPRQRLDDAIRAVSNLPFQSTDCSLPMLGATQEGIEVDTFIIYTDSETYAGNVHPHQALREYREKSGIDAKMIVVGMTSTGFTIADPADPGTLDIAGFDAAVPNLISDFARGI